MFLLCRALWLVCSVANFIFSTLCYGPRPRLEGRSGSEAAFVQRTRADWWAPESSEVPGPLLLLHPQIHPSPFLLISAMEASSCLPGSCPHHVPSPPNTLTLPSDSLSAHRPAQVAHENTFLKTYLLSRSAPQALPFPPALHDLPQEQSAVPASPNSPRAFVPSTVLDLVL